MKRTPKKNTAWQKNLPGILTGIAAVITAIGGIVIAIVNAQQTKPVFATVTPVASDIAADCANYFEGFEADYKKEVALSGGSISTPELTSRYYGLRILEDNLVIASMKIMFNEQDGLIEIASLIDKECEEVAIDGSFDDRIVKNGVEFSAALDKSFDYHFNLFYENATLNIRGWKQSK